MLKKIISNTLFQLLAKFVGVGLTFLTTVLIIRLSGPGLFGDLSKALSLVAIGFSMIDFGLNAEAVRSMTGSLREQRQKLNYTVQARLLLSIFAILVLNLLVSLLPGGYTPEIKAVFWVGSLAILFQGIYTSANAWFQRRLTYWKVSLATIIGTVIGTILTYLAIRFNPTLFNLLAASTVGYLVMAITSLLLLPRANPFSFNLKPILQTLKNSLLLGLILIASILAAKTDSVVLGIFRSSSEVGEYSFAYRIFDVALVLPAFVMNSVYPLLVGELSQKKKRLINRSTFALLTLGVIGALTLWLFAPLINWVRPGMEISVSSLRVLALSLPLFYVTAPLMWQLIEARLERWLLIIYLSAAIFNGITNLIFVPLYGATASAVLTCITEATILIGLLLVRKRYYEA